MTIQNVFQRVSTLCVFSFTALSLPVCFADEAIDLLTTDHTVESKTVRVTYDPLYKSPKNYEGYDLAELLAFFGHELTIGPDAKDVRLIAADNYVVILSPEVILAKRPVLAFEDLNAPYGKPWAPVTDKGRAVDPGPFYLVWPGLNDHKTVAWPYKIVKLDLVQKSIYSKIAPAADHPAYAGFELFVDNCSRCHSINLVGATLGPELNTPVSVLEYFNTDKLPAFIRNASSFRARSQMPDFEQLSNAEIGSIIEYLKYMQAQPLAD